MRSKVCLILTCSTLQEDLGVFSFYQKASCSVDMLELRVDYLNHNEIFQVHKFPSLVNVPVILTIRREKDGGEFKQGEYARLLTFFRCLNADAFQAKTLAGRRFEEANSVNRSRDASSNNEILSSNKHFLLNKDSSPKTFAYIDLEDDFYIPELEEICDILNIKIIRSYHSINEPIQDYGIILKSIKQKKHDIIKIASYATSVKDTQKLFEVSKKLKSDKHILISLGKYGLITRILSTKLGSKWTYAFSYDMIEVKGWEDEVVELESLVRGTYNFHQISKKSRLFGIIGSSVNSALSIAKHNQFLRRKKLNATYIPLSAQNIDQAIEMACYLGIEGLSVTAPFKIQAMQYATDFDEEAMAVGSCNTLIFGQGWTGKEIKAYNTDITGFQISLQKFLKEGLKPSLKVSVLGAGGAARAVCYVLYRLGFKNVIIFNRTYSKAHRLATQYKFDCETLDASITVLLHEYSDLIINTTSVGGLSFPNEDILSFYNFSGDEKVLDIAYRTVPYSSGNTPLVERAKSHGCIAENGYSMFRHQAEIQMQLFYTHLL